ncbi:hypothetical protein GUJ93_ZPchr0011g28517 [Zizania palustris]|uniref:Uncharacterized protein n=1 Tax=Zizania palustris TaxID=103762 RepID=A0A8J5WGK6_ZIZPA|nr:hypothetical protein GUJ93_ZPchr0011g28517 [Zizania palustris]
MPAGHTPALPPIPGSLLHTVLALCEVAAPLLQSIPWINHFHKTPDREWFETDAVLRVSLGNFLFFTILAIIMASVKDQKDPRDNIHHDG